MPRSKGTPTRQSPAQARAQARAQAQSAPAAGGDAAPDARHDAIAKAAYYKAERRGFAPGSDMQDWLDAERELGGNEQRA